MMHISAVALVNARLVEQCDRVLFEPARRLGQALALDDLGVGRGVPMLPLVLEPFLGRDPQVAATLSLVFLAPALVALAAATRRTSR